jgi:hypothetical protein
MKKWNKTKIMASTGTMKTIMTMEVMTMGIW